MARILGLRAPQLLLLSIFASLTVAVPTFTGSESTTVYINENPPADSFVVTVHATDPDGGAFTFALASDMTPFSIGAATGIITVSDPTGLDREMSPNGVTFTVNLLDADAAVADTLPVTVILNDVNDNSPSWDNPTTGISVSESTAVGTVLYTLIVSDADLGENADVRFNLLAPTDGTFSVNALTGIVSLARSLDFDTTQSYTIHITAQDQGNVPLLANIMIPVTITSVTGNAPVFVQTHYSVEVDEGDYSATPTSLVTVTARDLTDPSATIMYQRTARGDSTDTLFTVSATGVVSVAGALDRETEDYYMINVVAVVTDSAGVALSRTATATVAITVEDINDNSPVLENPHTDPIELLETQSVGVVIYSPIVTDADAGSNGDFSFQLLSPTNGPFAVNQLTGVVTLSNVLDYDVARSYTLNIRVQDDGAPTRVATFSLTVNVLDVLDPPPTFTQSTYNVRIAEDTYLLHPLINVVAVDTLHPGALIEYEQVMRGDVTDMLFSVNNATESNPGAVLVTGILDREAETTYTINIQAWRTNELGEVRSAVSLVSVVITVLDVNDNSPVLANTIPSAIALPENAPIGTIVYTLVVTDRDEGSNGEISFTLSSPAGGTFAVSSLGVVTLQSALNAATATSYSVIVIISDGGSSPNSITDTRTVTVVPTAIDPPIFGQLVYHVSQPEGDYSTEGGISLTSVSATTPAPNTVAYSQPARMDASDTLFSVNSMTGQVVLQGVLDRETTQTHVITIQATVIDAMGTAVTAATSTATVVVTVTDINDNAPTFFISNHVGTVSELADVGNIAVAGIRAFDLDEGSNSAFSFALADTTSMVPFAVDASTGFITVAGPLDYETTQQYSFMIKVQETSTTAMLQSQAQVTVNIVNENDNVPAFTATSFTFEIAENAAPATFPVEATDADLGVFGQLTYTLLGFGVGTLFSVDAATGAISTLVGLDYEARSVYHAILVAEDGTVGTSTPHRVTTSIVLEVLDVNDNAPILTPATHTSFLTEGLTYTNFLFVHATDADSAGPNSLIAYSIAFSDGTDSSGMFTIDAVTGGVSATGLDYETATSHSLTITATDGGSPALTDTASLTISVQPVNDLAPVFSMTTYATAISEALAVGSPIGVQVSATDAEAGHTVTYFSMASDADSAFFSVDQTSGVITLANGVDADPPTSHTSFSFRVIAVDDAAPPQTGTATIAVTVNGANDNTPVFTNPPPHTPSALTFTIAEGAGTAVPRPLITVVATDLDMDAITYAIDPASTLFSIDSATGDVVQTTTLDYVTSTQHSLTVTACDPDANCDTVTFTISVTDFNTNPPAFSATAFTPSISECDITDDYLIATVLATDLVDTGNLAVIRYSEVAGDVARFDLNEITGEIRASAGQNWDFETTPNTFVLEVRATDNPMGTPQLTSASDAVVTVTITDCNDHPPVFSQSSYAFTIAERTAGPAANEVVFSGVTVTDNDGSAANTGMAFSVVGGVASTNNWFDIDPASGEIFIRSGAVIDREDPAVLINNLGQGVMTFTILVTNSAPTATLTAMATVTVTITDINDHSPVFEQADPVRLSVVEHSQPPGSFLTDISATDADFGTNAHISYSITAGNGNSEFAIDSETGVMTVVGELDEENIASYTLTVQAENDLATGVSPVTITVILEIEESNDHNPIFTQAQYSVQLTEHDSILNVNGVMPGTTIGLVSASDQDGLTSLAGQVEYAVVSGNLLGGVAVFNITDPSTGVVIVLRPDLIDYEANMQFDMVIVAYDLVMPVNQRRQGTTHFIVGVRDINDNRPVFVDLQYYGSVAEEQPVGTSATLNSTILARDADANTVLTYSLVSGSPFSLSSDGRTLTTTAVLDRETTDSYSIIISVQDAGGYDATAMLYVQVTDINDNRPCFTQSSADLATSLPENVAVFPDPASMIVQTVTATDVDLDTTIMYYIGGGARGDFDVDSVTGEVRVVDPLDREEFTQYDLNITATDGLLTCSVTFTIMIDPVNDNNPVFDAPVYSASIREDAAIGSTVANLRFTATDLDPESVVVFEIVAGTSSSFMVTPDGFVVTNATLDRETRNSHTFSASATDGFHFSLENAFVEITVTDFNDERPVFSEAVYEVDVQELTPPNAIILIVNAEDADEGTNAEVRYSISAVNPPSSSGLFSIEATSGNIAPTMQIDINPGDPIQINLTITATDQGPFALTGRAIVVFNLVDRNLNAPLFTSPHYNFSVIENGLGERVGTVLAREPNGDLNTIISYGIVDSIGDGGSLFNMNTANGIITTAATLDRESRDVYTITVMATDNAAIPRTGFASVTINVLDDNDHSPVFDPEVYPIAISESTSVGSTIIRVLATDNDFGSNALLTYTITSGNNTAFSVDSGGIVTSQMVLDRESINNYTLIITATDGGAQPRSATANVTILINDENDNSPRFISGAVLSSDPVMIPEDAEPLTLITRVQAFDPDFQLNGIVIYTFDNLTLAKGPFQIDRETGEIRVRSGIEGRLDRETTASYALTVIASDQRGFGPQVRATVGTFSIDLVDVNDSIPTFTSPLYEFSLQEDFYREEPGGESPQPMFGEVVGVDRDVGVNAITYYHIIGDSTTNTSCLNQFCVGLETGNLFLIGSLDREAQASHIITVAVSNTRTLQFNETTGAPDDASTASVSITVTDFNDEIPTFVESTLVASVAEESEFGTTITTLRATDADIGNNSIVYFRILSNNVPYVVDRDTGDVTTAGVFAGLSGTIHSVEVEAFDNFGNPPTNRRTAFLNVRIYKRTDQVLLTFKTEKDIVEQKIASIQSALEVATGANIVITEVRVEQTDDGSVDTTGTDVLFFAVEPVTNQVIRPLTVIRLIDLRYSVVEAVFTQCDIRNIEVFRPVIVSATEIPYWVWIILGAMCLIIVCLCCCFLIGCVIERRRARRWRKQTHLHKSDTSELEQFSMFNYQTQLNPTYVDPMGDWDLDVTTSEISTVDRPNPIYASQEIELDVPPEDTDSEFEVEVEKEEPEPEPEPDTISRTSSESQEFKMTYDDDELEGPGMTDSIENLPQASGSRTQYGASPSDDDLLAQIIQDSDDDEEGILIPEPSTHEVSVPELSPEPSGIDLQPGPSELEMQDELKFDLESVSGASAESQEFKMTYDDDDLEGPGMADSTENLTKAGRKRKSAAKQKDNLEVASDEDLLAQLMEDDSEEDSDDDEEMAFI